MSIGAVSIIILIVLGVTSVTFCGASSALSRKGFYYTRTAKILERLFAITFYVYVAYTTVFSIFWVVKFLVWVGSIVINLII